MSEKVVTVQAVGIQNIRTGDDPGRDLEIYGNLGAWVKRAGSGIETPEDQGGLLMNLPDGMQVSITHPGTVSLGRSITMTVNDAQELWIGGHLWDDDDVFEDDDLGGRYERIPFAVIPRDDELRVRFHDRDNDQQVEAIFKVTAFNA